MEALVTPPVSYDELNPEFGAFLQLVRAGDGVGEVLANWRQFTLLGLVNAFVGAMLGLERIVVPLIAAEEFALTSVSVTLTFIISFGIVKALANLFAGSNADRVGRKPLLVAGWLIGLPVPLIIILAPSWGWIVFANILLGIQQGLGWSSAVIWNHPPCRRGIVRGAGS